MWIKKAISDKLNINKNKYTNFTIYKLIKNKKVLYIGKSVSIESRLIEHHIKNIDTVCVCYCKTEADMHIIEPYLICKNKPMLNKEFVTKDSVTFKIKYKFIATKKYKL